MNRGQLLLIAYHFPPDNAIGGARPFRFYKYLKRLGYQCHVLTAAPQSSDSGDIEHVPDPLRLRPRQGLNWQAERISQRVLIYGELALGWSQAVWRAGRSFLNGSKAARVTIISSAPPLGCHLAAWRLARHSGHRWIADFRDPVHSGSGQMAMLQRAVGPRVQGAILNSADLVLANTDEMRRAWGGTEKMHVIWNGFDPEDAIRPYPLPERTQKVISHVGELYGGRNIRPLIEAVARLRESGSVAAGALKILQVGVADAGELPEADLLRRATAEGWLELRDTVPAAEARLAALDSDGLLLVQPHTAVQVPGKLFEYLRMGRPILAYVTKGSPVERILEGSEVPFTCIYPEHSRGEIERRMLDFLGKFDGRASAPGAWFEENFEASRQAQVLDGLIRSLE